MTREQHLKAIFIVGTKKVGNTLGLTMMCSGPDCDGAQMFARRNAADVAAEANAHVDKAATYDAEDPTVELFELRQLFALQQTRMEAATARWRAEDPEGRALILPDLGALLRWLMDDADLARGITAPKPVCLNADDGEHDCDDPTTEAACCYEQGGEVR